MQYIQSQAQPVNLREQHLRRLWLDPATLADWAANQPQRLAQHLNLIEQEVARKQADFGRALTRESSALNRTERVGAFHEKTRLKEETRQLREWSREYSEALAASWTGGES